MRKLAFFLALTCVLAETDHFFERCDCTESGSMLQTGLFVGQEPASNSEPTVVKSEPTTTTATEATATEVPASTDVSVPATTTATTTTPETPVVVASEQTTTGAQATDTSSQTADASSQTTTGGEGVEVPKEAQAVSEPTEASAIVGTTSPPDASLTAVFDPPPPAGVASIPEPPPHEAPAGAQAETPLELVPLGPSGEHQVEISPDPALVPMTPNEDPTLAVPPDTVARKPVFKILSAPRELMYSAPLQSPMSVDVSESLVHGSAQSHKDLTTEESLALLNITPTPVPTPTPTPYQPAYWSDDKSTFTTETDSLNDGHNDTVCVCKRNKRPVKKIKCSKQDLLPEKQPEPIVEPCNNTVVIPADPVAAAEVVNQELASRVSAEEPVVAKVQDTQDTQDKPATSPETVEPASAAPPQTTQTQVPALVKMQNIQKAVKLIEEPKVQTTEQVQAPVKVVPMKAPAIVPVVEMEPLPAKGLSIPEVSHQAHIPMREKETKAATILGENIQFQPQQGSSVVGEIAFKQPIELPKMTFQETAPLKKVSWSKSTASAQPLPGSVQDLQAKAQQEHEQVEKLKAELKQMEEQLASLAPQ